MKNRRRPAWLKKVVFVWSTFFSVLSFMITLGISSHVYYFIVGEGAISIGASQTHPLYKLVCDSRSRTNYFTCFFCLSKIPELVDTFWLICGKKRIIFIHWFHHCTVVWFCWIAWAYAVPAGVIFALLNLSVKTVVYAWYALESANNWLAVGLRPVRFSQTVTLAQIFQIVLGLTLSVYVHTEKGCGNPRIITRFALWMYGIHCLLLAYFPFRIYIRKKRPVVRRPPYARSRILTMCFKKTGVTGVDLRPAGGKWNFETNW